MLGKDDRVGIMVFDRATRLRLPMRGNREDVVREFDSLLRQETFRGGTDITRALLDAAKYVGRNARREARRAIVILTDDQTEMNRDEARVEKALIDAGAVLSALIAPNAMHGPRYPGGGQGASWPGSTGPGRGGPLGGVIIGPGGRGGPGSASRTHSAGTSEIARASGGDSLPVDDASALETTLARLRQRYALYFLVPPGSRPGQERSIEVALATGAGNRYPGADLRFRRTYLAPGKPGDPVSSEAETTAVVEAVSKTSSESADSKPTTETPRLRRRPAVDEPTHARGPNPAVGEASSTSAIPEAASEPAATRRGGWRRVDEPEPGATTGSAPK